MPNANVSCGQEPILVNAKWPKISGWELRRINTSRAIEVAALEICLERGIDEITIEDIAQAAGISRRTFYRYFDTIDDILAASPRRSLDNIIANVRSRPKSESIREAFVAAGRNAQSTPEDLRIKALGRKLCRKYPVPWWRAMARIQPTANEVYRSLVEERLEAMGQDISLSPLITSILITVVSYVSQQTPLGEQYEPRADLMDMALRTIGEVMR